MAKTKNPAPTDKKSASKKAASAEKTPELIVPNKTFTLTIAASTITEARERALARAQKSIKVDGFRAGKVPLKVVAERLGQDGIRELILEDVLGRAYNDYIKANDLKPLVEPEVLPKSMEEGKDWEFELAIAESPELTLGDYVSLVKAAPISDHSDHDGHNHTEDDLRQLKLQDILKHLLANIEVRVPELLLRRETEHRLNHVARQLKQVNLGLEEYLKNIGKTEAELQQDYAINTLASLQVELLLAAVIRESKLNITESELQALVQTRMAGRKSDNPISREEITYLHSSLLKQKAVEHLLSL